MSSKYDRILEVFYNQPPMVIQWTPDRKQYSWGLVLPSRAENMLKKILNILLEEEDEDFIKIPIDVFENLHDFVMSRESDIDADIEDFGTLTNVWEWLCEWEDS